MLGERPSEQFGRPYCPSRAQFIDVVTELLNNLAWSPFEQLCKIASNNDPLRGGFRFQ